MQITLSENNVHTIIDKSLSILSRGGIIVYPSDTVYGLAVDGENDVAKDKIRDLKGRRPDQKFSYNFGDIDMIRQYHDITPRQEEILKKYLPGSFTFILEDDLSVRIPKDTIITEITKIYGKPITATSANITGKSSIDSIKFLDAKIYLAADLIIEDPNFVGQPPSTLVDLRSEPFKVIRQGRLPFED